MRIFTLTSIFIIASFLSTHSDARAVPIVACDSSDCRLEYKQYRKYARNGSPQAQIVLAGMYYSGYGVEQNSEQALRWYKSASRTRYKENSAFASYRAGLMYLFDHNIEQNIEKGLKLLSKSASKDNPDAAYQLADIYLQGQIVEQDLTQAEKWLTVASELNDAKSQYRLGLIYEGGFLGDKQTEKAIELYKKAAKQQNLLALERLQLLGLVENQSDVFALAANDDIEKITVSAPELSTLMKVTLTTIKDRKKFNRQQSCSKVPGSLCEHVDSITVNQEVEEYFRLNNAL